MTDLSSSPEPQPTQAWPKTYLLSIYNQAVSHGYIRIGPLTEAQARSLTASFYRLRRKSDSSNKDFIKPEFQLVTLTPWSPATQCLHAIYDKMPDAPLPAITAVSPPRLPPADLRFEPEPEPELEPHSQSSTTHAVEPDFDLPPEDISDYVARLRRQAAERGDG